MSRITITTETRTPSPKLVAVVRTVTGESIAETQSSIVEGRPVFDREIFDNHWKEHAEAIRDLLDSFARLNVLSEIHEDGHPISEEILSGILRASEAIMEETRQCDDMDHS